MAKFRIRNLNYIASGRNRVFVNIDQELAGDELRPRNDLLAVSGDTLVQTESGDSQVLLGTWATTDEMNALVSTTIAGMYNRGNVTFDIELEQENEDINALSAFSPMYDMVDLHVKSANPNRRDNFLKFDDSKDQSEDVYNPQLTSDPVEFTRVGGRTYMLTRPTKFESEVLRMRYAAEDTDYYAPSVEQRPHRTFLYPGLSELSAGGAPVSSLQEYFSQFSGDSAVLQGKIDEYFGDTRELSGVRYNHVLGLYHTNTQRKSDARNLTDFENGNVYADIYALKNTLDSTYSTRMPSADEVDGCREYTGLSQSRGNLYLKFQDDVQYRGDSGWFDAHVPEKRTWQKIEQFQPVNVNSASQAKHKSHFFSIRLNGTGIPDLGVGDEALVALKNDIDNAIKTITRRVAPANTQLLDVQIED